MVQSLGPGCSTGAVRRYGFWYGCLVWYGTEVRFLVRLVGMYGTRWSTGVRLYDGHDGMAMHNQQSI